MSDFTGICQNDSNLSPTIDETEIRWSCEAWASAYAEDAPNDYRD